MNVESAGGLVLRGTIKRKEVKNLLVYRSKKVKKISLFHYPVRTTLSKDLPVCSATFMVPATGTNENMVSTEIPKSLRVHLLWERS